MVFVGVSCLIWCLHVFLQMIINIVWYIPDSFAHVFCFLYSSHIKLWTPFIMLQIKVRGPPPTPPWLALLCIKFKAIAQMGCGGFLFSLLTHWEGVLHDSEVFHIFPKCWLVVNKAMHTLNIYTGSGIYSIHQLYGFAERKNIDEGTCSFNFVHLMSQTLQ